MAAFHCRSAVALHDRLMSVSFTPQPQALSAAIADRLRQEVLQGQWSPGETINDGMLAARYGVQRPPYVRPCSNCPRKVCCAPARRMA